MTLLLIFRMDLAAQEFWMMPDKFVYVPGDTIRIRFSVGENFAGETWNLRSERIRSVLLHANSAVSDLTQQARAGNKDHLLIPAVKEGTYQITMEGNNAFVELPAERFNEYLKENALDNVIALRRKTNNTDEPGREMYRRIAQVMVQVGENTNNASVRSTGLPLEIVPGKNTSTIRKGDMVQFKILFNGKPDFGARAFVWNRKDGKTFMQPIYSQQDGTVDVRIFNDGDWMISVVRMVPTSGEKADWQSFWGSLVFHVE